MIEKFILLFSSTFHSLPRRSCHRRWHNTKDLRNRGKSWKKKERRRSTLLLHSVAQLAELRTCRSVENVTSPISKCRPSADVKNPSSHLSFSSVSISFYFTSVGDVARVALEKTSQARLSLMSKRKWALRIMRLIIVVTITTYRSWITINYKTAPV